MIDLERLNKIHLKPKPRFQRLIATFGLLPNYNWPGRKTSIIFEGEDNVPRAGGCIFVMNHTDRYNYWPFQYMLWRKGLGFTAAWVKGKYYENPMMAWFMDAANNIPLPSKGYVLSKDFQLAMQRDPEKTEYETLKSYTDGKIDADEAARQGGEGLREFLARDWPAGNYADDLENRFRAMMQRVLQITREGLAKGLSLLVFPQGTRSITLTRGHTGVAQVVLDTNAPVVPVGCNGSDHAYPGSSPFSVGGTIIYRIGKPLTVEGDLKPFRINEPFVPFTQSAEKHHQTFRKLTDLMMDRINELLDPRYQYATDAHLAKGSDRFL